MTAALIISIVSALFGGGILFKLVSYSNAQAVQAFRHAQMSSRLEKQDNEIATLRTGLALTDQKLGTIESRLVKLDLIEVVHTNVEHLKAMADNMISRNEAEAKIKAVEDRVETLSAVVFEKH